MDGPVIDAMAVRPNLVDGACRGGAGRQYGTGFFRGRFAHAGRGDHAILHVIHRNDLPHDRGGVLDHMAFTAKDLPGVVKTLQSEGIEYELRRIAGGGIWQLFFHDPCGAKVEFDFDQHEPAPEGHIEAR